MWKTLTLAVVLATAATAHAQTKKELVAKVLKLQQPGIESMAQMVAEQPASQLLQQAGVALRTRVPEDKRDALAKELQAEAKKYSDAAVPIVRDAAVKAAPATIGTILEDKFTADELKQLVQILESPVNRKYQQLSGDMQRALTEKVVAEARPAIEPKVQALQQAMSTKINAAIGQQPAASAPAPR